MGDRSPIGGKPVITVIAGIVLIIAGVLVWIATLSVTQGLAILMVVAGILLLLHYAVPGHYYARGGRNP
jgi:arginine exporter protein ArgO